MIFHFQTGDVTFFAEDKAYFEKRITTLLKYLGSEIGDDDSVVTRVSVQKNKHISGDKFEAKAHITSPNGGDFHAEVETETLQKAADLIHDKLSIQMRKFHDKHKN